MTQTREAPLALWGGHECTVNRVGDRVLDQTVRTGHQRRLDDLDRFAALGLKTLRYPLLWERTAPERPDEPDWRWADERLGRLREFGVAPIAGLVHHGSGPRYTHLLDDGFARGLAAHARGAAERYPWIEAWTPVNEPLTTARFSALYGHWHPHARDEYAMCVALLNQVDAVRLAMGEVRAVNPGARLVQTEDMGHVFATDPLLDQAEFENERRWLSLDLLCGRVTPGHRFFARIAAMGLGDRLRAIADDPCPPDVVGINHYLSSERLLDHRIDLYPPERRGGNFETPYADVEAVRAVAPGPLGVERLLELAWARYGLPLAVTEAHLGCTRDEQMRWLQSVWDAAGRLRDRGVAVEAVTVWSLLGAVDWCSLLTREEGRYEPGVFDIRSGAPRPTALAGLVRRLATGEGAPHPAQAGQGWWERDIRFAHAPVWCGEDETPARTWRPAGVAPRPVLVTGATGTLGRAFARALHHRGHAYVLTDRAQLDVTDPASVAEALDGLRPWAVVNAAGYVRVDDAEREREACMAANADAVRALARACADRDLPLLAFSSDLVFDGSGAGAYLEDDAPAPLNVYGASKAVAERAVIEAGGRGLIVRTSAFFSPLDPHNFAHAVAHTLAAGRPFRAAADQAVSPTYVADLVDTALDLMIDGETGVRHLANRGVTSWAAFAVQLAKALSLDAGLVEPAAGGSLGQLARRPARVELGTRYGPVMPTLEDAIARYAAAVRPTLTPVKRRAQPIQASPANGGGLTEAQSSAVSAGAGAGAAAAASSRGPRSWRSAMRADFPRRSRR